MMIANAAMRALDDIAARERDVLQSYAPGAIPERTDVAAPAGFTRTMDPLCAAPPPEAYFVTRDDRAQLLFTQDGSFALRDGELVDAAGRPVLGYSGASQTLAPLRVDAVDAALGIAANARVESDGTVGYDRETIEPSTGQHHLQKSILGRLALARFAPGTKMQPIDPQHAAAPPGILPHIGKPGDGNFGALIPYARSNSGVDIDLGLQQLQEAYLALDAIRSADQAQRGVEKTAMDLLK